MTATIKPPARHRRRSSRRLRFSAMETLGFSNPPATWSEQPVATVDVPRGRHVARALEPDRLADWQPEDPGTHLSGRDFRWSIVLVVLLTFLGLGVGGAWLYMHAGVEAEAARQTTLGAARTLDAALPALYRFNEQLVEPTGDVDGGTLFSVASDARALFEASGSLGAEDPAARAAAGSAAAAALDGVRLAGEAHAYREAVNPILQSPSLETDPTAIELDEAARAFGAWQLQFDQVRTALPDGVLTPTTDQLDLLSVRLPTLLTGYIDALRADDQPAATAVLDDLAAELEGVSTSLTASLADVHDRVADRLGETRTALSQLVGD